MSRCSAENVYIFARLLKRLPVQRTCLGPTVRKMKAMDCMHFK
jgi:hypothetical protein